MAVVSPLRRLMAASLHLTVDRPAVHLMAADQAAEYVAISNSKS